MYTNAKAILNDRQLMTDVIYFNDFNNRDEEEQQINTKKSLLADRDILFKLSSMNNREIRELFLDILTIESKRIN
tara:strand:- start:232 stop:456 length:225 start_codon:yes stop_codon:yes gene_type:complete